MSSTVKNLESFQKAICELRDDYGFGGVICIVSDFRENKEGSNGVVINGLVNLGEAAIVLMTEALKNVDKEDREDAATIISVMALNEVNEEDK